jgi:signal transduction histidine kinase/HAMP domain-containing protein
VNRLKFWGKFSLGGKLALLLSSLFVLLVVVLTAASVLREQANFRKELEQQANLLLNTLPAFMSDSLYFLEIDELRDIARMVVESQAVSQVAIYDRTGALLVDTERLDEPGFSQQVEPLGELLAAQPPQQVWLSWEDDALVAGRSIEVGNKVIGAAALSFSKAPLAEKIATLIGQNVLIAVLTLALGLSVALLLTRRMITDPLAHLAEVAAQMSAGRYDERIRVNSTDEIGQLGSSYNRMAGSIGALLQDLENQAAVAQSRLFQAIESISDGFVLYDDQDRFVMSNSRYRQMMPSLGERLQPGMSFEEILRLSLEIQMVDARLVTGQADWFRERLRRHKQPGEPFELLLTDGRWLLVSEYATPEGELVGVYRDISQQKHYEHQLEESIRAKDAARAAAEQASATKSAFLANMSHELRTPLNAIIGFTRIVRRKSLGLLPEKQIENLDKVLGSADHLLELINNILDISKIEAGRMEITLTSFDLKPLVDDCISTVTPLARPGVRLFAELPATLVPLVSDSAKVTQILLNLLGNAVKFTHSGEIALSVSQDANGTCLSVRDTGIGIPGEALGKIFDEFQQVDSSTTRKYGGTGLGLAISRHMARLLGGELSVESTVGRGSTFTLCLPERPPGRA